MFLTFARLDGSEEHFLKFANDYGRLGTFHELVSNDEKLSERQSQRDPHVPGPGEPLDEWQEHYRWMNYLVRLWSECLKERPKLGRFVSWDKDEVVYQLPRAGCQAVFWRSQAEIRFRPKNSKGEPLFRQGDMKDPALWFLGYALDDWIQELNGRDRPITCRLSWSEKEARPLLFFRPSNLLGAMVCQFAAAVHGVFPFKECAYCHKFFRLEPGTNRANRLTCSTTCKQYLYHRRIEQARELHAAGRTLGEIAKELSVKPRGDKSGSKVVKGWIETVKQA
jgi:hypothetical protein